MSYEKQDRGALGDYEAYFAGMDKSMQQKVALTTAHFPTRGRIADMGSGSGRGTFDLACLYSGLELVGVDINPTSVQIAAGQFQRSNLSYQTGDISQPVFSENSLNGILNSSVLHHVTSFNSFDVRRVLGTLDNQCLQLQPGGVLIIRDFVIPNGPDTVDLDLPTTDGSNSGNPPALSTAALFERFAAEWRSSINPDAPLTYSKLASVRAGFVRYRIPLRIAAEFVLRKDYREDWAVEVLEEYTYLSQSGFEEAFRKRNMRIVASMPLWNPWIVQNRFQGRFHLQDLEGTPLPFPPTNYLIVGEKVAAGEGVEIVEHGSRQLAAPVFLKCAGYRNKDAGHVYELVERPNPTIDLLPWFEISGQVFVMAKKDFPRPIVNACASQRNLNNAHLSGYITEPVSAIVADANDRSSIERVLRERGNIPPQSILGIEGPHVYYPSAGGINERVLAYRIHVQPPETPGVRLQNYTQFRDAGSVREMDASQTLRASQVGGMFDARLEINIYLLLHALQRSTGPWIGAEINPQLQGAEIHADAASLQPEPASCFEPCELTTPAFLSLFEGTFREKDAAGNVLAEVAFEYVAPASFSKNTVSAVPVARTKAGIFVGLEHRDLPAVQAHTGNSRIVTVPAWRLPRTITHRADIPAFLATAFLRDFQAVTKTCWELGGPYFSSPGVTPESVFPFAVEIDATSAAGSALHFVEVETLRSHLQEIRDAHLLVSACRLLHALH